MTNEEVFKEFFNEKWVIENQLCFLLQEYDEAIKNKPGINKVGFIKEFMKQETYIDINYAEKSLMERIDKEAIDVNCVES